MQTMSDKEKIKMEAYEEFYNKLKSKEETSEDYTKWVSIKNINAVFEELIKNTKMPELKTVKVELNKEELGHLINDIISYMWEIEDKCKTEKDLTARGYYTRKALKEKLQKIEAKEFPQLDCCGD